MDKQQDQVRQQPAQKKEHLEQIREMYRQKHTQLNEQANFAGYKLSADHMTNTQIYMAHRGGQEMA